MGQQLQKEALMDCHVCGGTLVEGMAHHHITRRGYHLLLDNVPALVCTQCHTPWFDSEVVGYFDEAIRALDQLDERLHAFDMARTKVVPEAQSV
jgi:YgiT-type zinc finger domain-containing protein